MIILIFLTVFVFIFFEVKFDYTKEKQLLLWYTINKKRKYLIIW